MAMNQISAISRKKSEMLRKINKDKQLFDENFFADNNYISKEIN